MLQIKPEWRITVLGMTQSGKSHFAKHLLGKYKNYLIYDFKGEYSQFGAVAHNLAELATLIKDGCNRLVYVPTTLEIEEFDQVAGFVYNRLRNIVFVVDEAHNFCSKGYISPNFKRLITAGQGEPRNLGVMAISQRGQNLHNDVLGNSSMWVIFQVERFDAEYLSKRIKLSQDELEQLPPRYFYVYSNRATDGSKLEKHSPI